MLIDRNYNLGEISLPKVRMLKTSAPLTQPAQGIVVDSVESAEALANGLTIYALASPTTADVDFIIKNLLVIKVRDTNFKDTDLDDIMLYGRHVDLRADWCNEFEAEYQQWYLETFKRVAPTSFLDLNDLAHFELFYFYKTAGATYKLI